VLKWFPLLAISVALYNILIFVVPAASGAAVDQVLGRYVDVQMFSGDIWHFTLADFIVLISLVLLFIEVVKSTGTGAVQVLNHAMSMLVFIVAMAEFMVVRGFATTAFFIITAMCFFDVVAGFTVSIVAAKRDLGATHGIIGTN
jgi:hypothetical protein